MTQDFMTSKKQGKTEIKQLINQLNAMTMKSRQQGRSQKGKSQKSNKSGLNGRALPVITSGPVVNDMFQRSTLSKRKLGGNRSMAGLSPAGEMFLKAAFAAPDFANQGAFQGIPDDKTYVVAPARLLLAADLDSLGIIRSNTPNIRLGLIQMPVPGVAFYWFLIDEAGVTPTTIFHPVYYDTFESIFGYDPDQNLSKPQDNSKQVVEFRMASNTIEVICTSNSTQWYGSIRAFKLSATLEPSTTYQPQGVNTPLSVKISGLTGVGSTGAASFITPSNLGVYMSALNKEVIFNTKPITDMMVNINDADTMPDGVVNGNLTGWGDLECNVIMFENVDLTKFTIRTWQTLELVPNSNSSLVYTLARPSPVTDPLALTLYRELVDNLPVAVTYFENDTFWKRLLGVVSRIGTTLSVIPGPWGALAGGIGGVSGTIASMVN